MLRYIQNITVIKLFQRIFINLLLVGLFSFSITQNAFSQDTICEKIDKMVKNDQNIREYIMKNPEDSLINLKLIKEVDSLNIIECYKIIKTYGIIDTTKYGPLCSKNFWLLIQHADQDINLQKKYLRLLRNNNKMINIKHLAYLKDRILINLNKKQLYGTQGFTYKKDNILIWEPKPIKNSSKIEIRRKKMNLESLKKYILTINNLINM